VSCATVLHDKTDLVPHLHHAEVGKRIAGPLPDDPRRIYLSNSQRYAARGRMISGAGHRPFPFSSSLADEGDGAPGGAGRVGLNAPWRTPPRSAQRRCGGAFAPSDVGGRRLPALQLRRFGWDHVLPIPAASLPIRSGPEEPVLGRDGYLFMLCSSHSWMSISFSIEHENP
jgi:hypothetical protein